MINADLICLLAGPVITILVGLFKKVTFVQNNPKIAAFIISAIIGGFSTVQLHGGLDASQLVQCILVPFAGAVATFEVKKSATQSRLP